MHNRFSTLAGFAAGCILMVGCSDNEGDSDAGTPSRDGAVSIDSRTQPDGTGPSQDAATPSPDTAGACCPTGFLLYDCQQPDGHPGMACHNPALGCASSTVCGQGCDPQVVGRCDCVEDQLCMVGLHFDRSRCSCVPNQDAGAVDTPVIDARAADTRVVDAATVDSHGIDASAADTRGIDVARPTDTACIDNVLCIRGDHFDPALCRCVPDLDAAVDLGPRVDAACVETVLCVRGDHFDPALCRCVPDGCSATSECTGALPALCQLCSDGSSGCAHFACVAGQCTIAYCP